MKSTRFSRYSMCWINRLIVCLTQQHLSYQSSSVVCSCAALLSHEQDVTVQWMYLVQLRIKLSMAIIILQLRNISKIIQDIFYVLNVLKNEFFVFVSWPLDYFKSLYSCVSQGVIARLQMVQNAATHLLNKTKTQGMQTSTLVLAFLQWLPVEFTVYCCA